MIRISLAVIIQHRIVTNREIDTFRRQIPRLYIQHRARVKMSKEVNILNDKQKTASNDTVECKIISAVIYLRCTTHEIHRLLAHYSNALLCLLNNKNSLFLQHSICFSADESWRAGALAVNTEHAMHCS